MQVVLPTDYFQPADDWAEVTFDNEYTDGAITVRVPVGDLFELTEEHPNRMVDDMEVCRGCVVAGCRIGWLSMATEYRLVMFRPKYQDGSPRTRIYRQKNLEHAEQGLADWQRDMERYAAVGLEAWPGHIETRDVTPWIRVVAAADVDWSSR